jgi:hypothetical protein
MTMSVAGASLAKEPSERRAGKYSNTAKRCERGILPPAASGRPEGGSAAREATGQGRS